MTDVYSSMIQNAVAAVLFAIIGVVLFVVAFMVFDKLTPGSLWKELIEDQNTAIGVLMGAVAIALALLALPPIFMALRAWGMESARWKESDYAPTSDDDDDDDE